MEEKFTHINEDEIKEALENQNLASAVAKIQDYYEQLDRVELNIAVTGESGAGKSTFVNALRGLQDEDEGAAQTGVVETTMEPVMYPHPKYPMVKLWDLPGTGTPNFKADTYLEKVKFQCYDFFIIINSDRFKYTNVQLAIEIQGKGKTFYFVRTKIDNDLRSEQKKTDFNEEKTLQLIRQDCIKGLQANGVGSPKVFLISSHQLARYDFHKLEKTIQEELPKHKRHALLLSLPNMSDEINKGKKKVLQENMWKLALLSGAVALMPIPGLSFSVDVAILVKELQRYYEAFGLDNKSLKNLSDKTGVPFSMLKAAIKSPFKFEISRDLVVKLLISTAGAGLMMAEECVSFIPIVGSFLAGGISFSVTYRMLLGCLDELAEDAHNVLMRVLQTEL